jgi:hypothetical protein
MRHLLSLPAACAVLIAATLGTHPTGAQPIGRSEAPLVPNSAGGSHSPAASGGRASSLTVAQANAWCSAHPHGVTITGLSGWFLGASSYVNYTDGVLFASKAAVPSHVVNLNLNRRWVRYGGIFAHITTRASSGGLIIELHGRLTCATRSFVTDRDPFPAPRLSSVYTRAATGNRGPIGVSATAGGLRLTLTVPRRSYPRNALARVTVRVENVSHHDVTFMTPGIAPPGVTAPQVQVLDRTGHALFPPALSDYPPLPGPAPSIVILHPGETQHMRLFIIVRGARIRATIPFTPRAQPFPSVQYPLNALTTRPITVRLTSAPSPTVTEHQTSAGPVFDVTRPPGAMGTLWWVSYTDCGDVTNMSYTFGWVPTGPRLGGGCRPVQSWHATLGYLNEPVTSIAYTAPVPTATPAASGSG